MPLQIIRDDITRLETDVIVNAANSKLLAGGGVCGAIFSAAGAEELQKACNEIGYCGIGDAVITKGFGLKAKYIIHTVGPIYGQDPKNEESQLYSCYQNSLALAKENNLKSIAFPIISSGIYGYPKAEAIKTATRAIKDFLDKDEDDTDVYLVVYDRNAFRISEKLFDKVKSYIDDRMVKPDLMRSIRLNSYEDTAALDVKDHSEIRKDLDAESVEVECVSAAEFNFDESVAVKELKTVSKLENKKSLEELINIEVETFSEMLLRLIDEKGMTDVEVYKRANIDRKLFSKIRKKNYTPKKSTVLALVISLRLNMEEARQLLARAGFAFSECSKFDLIIEYFIENGEYDIFKINETLFAFEQQLLGA